MACSRFSSSQFSLLRPTVSSPFLRSLLPTHPTSIRKLAVSVSLSAMNSSSAPAGPAAPMTGRWKPMCLYFTQGKCTKKLLPVASLSFAEAPPGRLSLVRRSSSRSPLSRLQKILPVTSQTLALQLLSRSRSPVGSPTTDLNPRTFNPLLPPSIAGLARFVRPTGMSEERVIQYIEGKYGKFGVDRVWHDTAIVFKYVLEEFEEWMTNHQLWKKETGGPVHRAAFVTCGNWDLKTKIPQQCKVSNIRTPPYFMEWINLKDIYLNFYNRRATGMMTMMRQLGIPSLGSHHLGIDDTKNITKVLRKLLADGVLLQITARRSSSNPSNVEFMFKNRIV